MHYSQIWMALAGQMGLLWAHSVHQVIPSLSLPNTTDLPSIEHYLLIFCHNCALPCVKGKALQNLLLYDLKSAASSTGHSSSSQKLRSVLTVLACWSCHNAARTGQGQNKHIISWFWSLEVHDQNFCGAASPLLPAGVPFCWSLNCTWYFL